MNLLAPMPTIDETPADAVGVEVARVLDAAKISTEGELLDALMARRNELNLSNEVVEKLANMCGGHLTKVLGPSKEKSPTLATVHRILMVLGLSIVLVIDPQKVAAVRDGWRPRAAWKARQRQLSPTTIARAQPIVMAELARKASRPKWKDTPAPMFLRALMNEAEP
jgi:hypothetical protein